MVLGASMYESYFGNQDMFDELAGIQPADYSDCETVAEACFRAMEEDAVNWANFDRALALNELNYLRENGEEIVYEAVDIKGIIGKGVAMVKSWFSKVMGVVQKFMSQVSAKLASATKWLGVNKKKLVDGMSFPEGKAFEDLNFKAGKEKVAKMSFAYESGNPFDGLTSRIGMDDATAEIKNMDAYLKQWTGKADGNCTVNDIKTNALGKDKIKIDGSYMSSKEAHDVITSFKAGIVAVNDAKKEAKGVANNMIKSINDLKKSLKDGSNKDEKNAVAKSSHAALKAVSKINAANSTLLTAKLIVMTGYLHQAQKIARIYLGQASSAEKDAKKAKREAEKNDKKNKKAGVQNASALEDVLGFELV